jgi:hypothetical protein
MGTTVDGDTQCVHLRLPGQRDQIRQFACISVLDFLRRRLRERGAAAAS